MDNYINLAHLKFFCDTVIYESMSEAAKKNHITQSAISQGINKLESYFGVPLLIHNKQKLVMTDQGKIVFDRARIIFKSINETFVEVDQSKDALTGHLKFITTKSLGMSFYAPTYPKIKKNLPNLELTIKMGSRTDIRTKLRREEVEFAIVVYDSNYSQFDKQTIRKGYFNLYQPKNIPNNELKNEIFIDEHEGMYIQEFSDFLCTHNQELKMVPLSGWEIIANFVNLGNGLGFFADYVVSETRFPNIQVHPLQLPPYEYEIAAIYNKSSQLSRAARAFLEQFTLL